ncbi:MAG: hypothetical protein IJU93_02980, partial [Lachnospiraceae bacterium]|nr:hypothetical protein [Lachnospiraceae bacterium]
MYDFKDYFETERRNKAYTAVTEETEDYLRLLDMMLERYLEHKGINKEDKLFSRGLLITESEMRAYFEMPPYLRDRDIWDPTLATAVD